MGTIRVAFQCFFACFPSRLQMAISCQHTQVQAVTGQRPRRCTNADYITCPLGSTEFSTLFIFLATSDRPSAD
ncbi:hypothetical protein BKA64DRAFT_19746 [Cadophora sp. MPI-SDFR-AT-0126]|nr:hypothetical protein BKA64DRAFT_19746 [Leotiomycetes sp. MPI-SDFR-AT-0126]